MAEASAAVERVRARALALLGPGHRLSLASDADTFARGKRPAVLLAVARPGWSVVIAIDASEYNGMAIAIAAGLHVDELPNAYDRAVVAQRTLTDTR